MTERVEEGRVTLADIIGVTDWDADRVVNFAVAMDGLQIGEACDDYYWMTLNTVQIDQLIVWLTEAKRRIEELRFPPCPVCEAKVLEIEFQWTPGFAQYTLQPCGCAFLRHDQPRWVKSLEDGIAERERQAEETRRRTGP